MRDQVEQQIMELQAADARAQTQLQALSEQARPWEEDRRFIHQVVLPAIHRWESSLNAQISQMAIGKARLGKLKGALLRARVYPYLINYHPRVMLKQAQIFMIAALGTLKLILFLLIQLVLLIAVLALGYFIVRLVIFIGSQILGFIQSAFQSAIQFIQALPWP